MSKTFTYTTEAGEKITVPAYDTVATAGFIRRNRRESESELGWMLLEKAADDEALAIIDELPQSEFVKFSEEWQKDSGAGLGESSKR